MKKEYYIQGDPASADKIKAAFEAKGFNTSGINFENKTLLYFSFEGCIKHCSDDWFFTCLIKTHPGYTELPLSVEPNFKVGDWVVKKNGKTFYGGNYAEQITLIEVDENGKRIWFSSTTWTWDDDIRLWTIQDAKDGDVLATDNGWTCIFQAFDGWTFSSYCFMDSEKWFYEFGSEVHTPDSRINGNIHPATKEQRDLFFKRMREAGYQWDPGKKELKKTPVKPKFKAGDWLWHKEKGVFPVLIAGYGEERGYLAKYIGSESYFGRDATEKEYRLWTIADAKDGDVLVNDAGCIFINAGFEKYDNVTLDCYCYVSVQGIFYEEDHKAGSWLYASHIHPATKEQRDLLFTKMKEAGYQWDEKKKELRKIQHYDIANFQPFDKVLVRDGDMECWNADLFSSYHDEFHCFRGSWEQCIPFSEDTKHLLGTTDPCDERYVNW